MLSDEVGSEYTKGHVHYRKEGGTFKDREDYAGTGTDDTVYSFYEAQTKCESDDTCTGFTCSLYTTCTMRSSNDPESATMVNAGQPHVYRTYIPHGSCGHSNGLDSGEITRSGEHGKWYSPENLPSFVKNYHEKYDLCKFVALTQ
jgi:hypothetical protein